MRASCLAFAATALTGVLAATKWLAIHDMSWALVLSPVLALAGLAALSFVFLVVVALLNKKQEGFESK
jgi:hypothetical protein